MLNIIRKIIKESKWITADDSWLEKMVWHETEQGKESLAQVYQEIDVLSTKPKNFITTFA